MKSIVLLMMVLAVTISPAAADYTLTIQTDPAFITTVSPFVGQGQFSGSVELEAQRYVACPYVYRFDHWEGDGIADPNASQTTVFVDAPMTITAVFADDRKCGDECHDDQVPGDINHNCIVDLEDIAMLAANWLVCSQPGCDELMDLEPPVPSQNQDPVHPYKAQHAMLPDSIMTDNWYQVVFAVEAVDPSGVEYRFICDNAVYSSGGSIDPGPVWRNSDNVGAGTAEELYPGGLAYQGSAYQVPHVYIVSTSILYKPDLIWFIVYRDRSANQNMGDFSDGLSESGQVVPPPF